MRFTTAFDLMRRGAMDVEGLLTHTFPLEECGRALDTIASQAPAVIKAMLTL
jgi:threonine dehydrogenase-like Zn-dependent dehydrogenase